MLLTRYSQLCNNQASTQVSEETAHIQTIADHLFLQMVLFSLKIFIEKHCKHVDACASKYKNARKQNIENALLSTFCELPLLHVYTIFQIVATSEKV